MYSQNNEEEVILNYFGQFRGVLLDIGANDGKTLSNSLALIEKGWHAALLEPAPGAFYRLEALHKGNEKVRCFNTAIGTQSGVFTMWDSGSHLGKGDTSLLSTIRKGEKDKWEKSGEQFTEIPVGCLTWNAFINGIWVDNNFDFITIDAEGMDYEILRQIDLSNTKCLCIEHNNNDELLLKYTAYCAGFGLNKILLKNFENVIIAREKWTIPLLADL